MANKKQQKKKRGPYLAAALLCDHAMNDKADGALSVIRIVDQVKLSLPSDAAPDFPSKENRLPVYMVMVLSFKTGDSPGTHSLRVVMESPSGKIETAIERELAFSDEQQGGSNVILKNTIMVYHGGVFWYNIYLDGKLMTRMPLKVTIEKDLPPKYVPAVPPTPTDQSEPKRKSKKASRR
ncbi:MAG TPA: hypothetical protein VK395_37520 [Gemmataceae bacterium]|nr:hypothetical protein [Gemmataceae bacterium]